MPAGKTSRASITREAVPRAAGDTRRAEFLAIAAVLLLAIVLRVVYFLQYKVHAPYYSVVIVDSYYYDVWAQRIADGRGFGPVPFYMAPLYPYVLAAFYKVVGHNLPLVYILQLALGVANVFMVYMLGRRLFGHVAGLAAMVLMIFYWPLAYLETKLMTETLAIALGLAGMLLLMRALDRPTITRFLTTGVVLGLAADCRSNALITIVLFAGWLLLSRDLRRSRGFYTRALLPLAIGVVLAILPVTARNYVVGRDLVLISSNGGIVFAQGNNDRANGVSAPLRGFSGSIGAQRDEEMAHAREALGHPVKPSESSAYWFGEGMKFIREQPADSAWLILRKAIWTLHNREARCSYNPYLERDLIPVLRLLILPFPLLAALALFGFLLGKRRGNGGGEWVREREREKGGKGERKKDVGRARLLPSRPLEEVLPSTHSLNRNHATTPTAREPGLAQNSNRNHPSVLSDAKRCIEGRYHVSQEAIPALYALSIFLSLIVFSVSSRYRVPAVPALAVFAGFGLVQAVDAFRARTWRRLAIFGACIVPIALLSLMPYPVPAVTAEGPANLGVTCLSQGRLVEAERHFREALAIQPDYVRARNSLGIALARQGKYDDAMEQFQVVLRKNPNDPDAHKNVGLIYKEQGRIDEALAEFQLVVKLMPAFSVGHSQLGYLLATKGQIDEAIAQYKEAVRLDDEDAAAHCDLGVLLDRKGNVNGARREYRRAISLDPTFARAYGNLAVSLYLSGDYSGAWAQVRLAREHGGTLPPDFIRALSARMPEPH